MLKLNFYKIFILLAAGAFLSGCYTQFAMYDGGHKIHRAPTDEEVYSSENMDSDTTDYSYTYEDTLDTEYEENDAYFENNYYLSSPSYHRYFSYYYPSFSIGFSYGYPYYNPFCWDSFYWDPFFPSYCYTPYVYYPYNYYDYWFGYPYYYSGYYSYNYGSNFSRYKYRDNNRFSLRNTGGLRNSYNERDPLSRNTLSREGNLTKSFENKERDVLSVNSKSITRGTNNTVVNKNSARIDVTHRINKTSLKTKTDIKKNTTEIKKNDPKILNRNQSTTQKNPVIEKGSTEKIDLNKTKTNQTPKIKNDIRNNPPKINGTYKKNYQTPKNYNPPKNTYKPPTKNNTPPNKSYNPPTRNYSPPTKTYSPPTKTYSPPPRNSGNNSGSSTRKNTR